MKERPINLKAHEVLAILQGRKTQLRRVVKPQPSKDHLFLGWVLDSTSGNDIGKAAWAVGDGPLMRDVVWVRCPFGQVGDRLWVRETWRMGTVSDCSCYEPCGRCPSGKPLYAADFGCEKSEWGPWKPSIHMPRWASRILLEVVSVRVERLQGISEEDAFSEGIERIEEHSWSAKGATPLGTFRGLDEWSDTEPFWTDATDAYRSLWEIERGLDSWSANPWVWVVEFKRIDKKGGAV